MIEQPSNPCSGYTGAFTILIPGVRIRWSLYYIDTRSKNRVKPVLYYNSEVYYADTRSKDQVKPVLY